MVQQQGPQPPRGQGMTTTTSWLCVAAYSTSFVVFGLQVNLLGPTASVLARKLGVVEADLGVIFTLNGLASIIGGLPSGWLVDKLPGHAVLATALGFEALGYAAIPFCNSMLTLALAFSFVALSWNIVNTAGNTFVLHIAAQLGAGNSSLINGVNACFGVGSLAAPLVAELCASRLTAGPLAAYWITAGLTAASAASFLLLPSPGSCSSSSSNIGGSAAAAAAGDDGGSLQQPLLAHTPAAEADSDSAAATADAALTIEPPAQAAGCPRGWWPRPLVLLLVVMCAFNLLNVGTEVGFGGWIATYATQQAGLSEHAARTINSCYWGSFTLGRVAASFAALVLSPVTLLLASLPLAVVGAAGALAAPAAWLRGEGGAALLSGVTVLVGLGVAPGFANALALLDSICPVTGQLAGLLGGVAGAGCMTVPLVVAALAKYTPLAYQGLMWVSLGSFTAQLLCVPLALLLGRQVQQHAAQQRQQRQQRQQQQQPQQPRGERKDTATGQLGEEAGAGRV